MTGQPNEDPHQDKRFNRKKTDFSEYTEVSVRFMKGLITEKSKPK
jgi:hypothetical protein